MNRRPAIAAALAAAMAFAVLLVAAPDHGAIPVGRRGDAPFLSGFGPPVEHRAVPGRWTGGRGVVDLPPTPLGGRVTIELHAGDGRAGEPVELFVDGVPVARDALAVGRHVMEVAVAGCDPFGGCPARRLTLQSAVSVDPGSGERRGVFVAGIGIERGGGAGTPATAWAVALALVAGIVAAAFAATGSVALAAGAVLWCAAALWIFRVPLSPCWAWLAAAAWVSAGVGVIGRRTGDVAERVARRLPAAAGFAIWAGALVGLLFLEAFTRGWVFGQPQALVPYHPWRPLLPDAWTRVHSPFGDVPMLVYPFLAHARDRLLAGDFPLWTASLNAGQPFLGAYQAAIFSPLTWIVLLVPLPQAAVPIAVLRLLVGGVGMFVFVRGLGLSRGAAFVAGTGYLLNPFSTIWLEHPPAGVPPWLPWLLHAATRAAEGRRFGPAGLALATTLVFLGGHPHTGVFCVLFAAAWAAAVALAQPARWSRLATAAAAMTLGAALAAIQIVPFLEYLFASRGYAWRQIPGLNSSAAPVSTVFAALVPRFLGDHASDTYAGMLNFLEQTMYAGIPIVVLAAAGLAGARRDWRVWFFAACGAIGALAVYGTPGILHAISAVPLVRSAALTRLPIVPITAAIVAAAFGVEALIAATRDVDRRRAVIASCAGAGAIAAVILVALLARRSFLERTLLTTETWRWSAWAVVLAAGTAATSVAIGREASSRRAGAAALTALVAVDLFVFARGFHPLVPRELVYPAIAELTPLGGEARPFRVVGAQRALVPNSALVYGLHDVRAYDGLGVRWYVDLLDGAFAWVPANQQHELRDAEARLLDLLGIRYLLAPPAFTVDPAHWERVAGTTSALYRNRREGPRAALVDGYVVSTGVDAMRRLHDGTVDFRRDVILEAEPPTAERPERAAGADAVGTVRIAAYADERVEIETAAAGRRLLVLTDTWFPGWRATIDGVPVAIARANVAFRAVPLPPGRHRVVFEYAPASFRAGAAISGAAAVVLMAWSLVEARRRRRPGP